MTRQYPRTLRAAAAVRSTAPPAVVYDLLIHGQTWPTWIDLDSMALEQEGSDGGESVGAIRVFRFRRAGIRFTTRERVVELKPDRQFSYALVSGLPLRRYRADVVLTPTPEGGTHIHWSGSWTTGIPVLGRLTEPVMKRLYKQFARGVATNAEELEAKGDRG